MSLLKAPEMIFRISKFGIFLLVLIFIISAPPKSNSQSISGNWEGIFMDQFQIEIEFNQSGNLISGVLKMYSDKHLLQEDSLDRIAIINNQLSFSITAKETDFIGDLNLDKNTIAGILIFPDDSQHILNLRQAESTDEILSSDLNWYPTRRNEKIPKEKLISDLEFLKSQLEKYHPQLNSYTTKIDFDDAFQKTQLNLSSMALTDYYLTIAPLVEMIKCSHTGIRMPHSYYEWAKKQGNYLPVELYFINGKAYSNYSALGLSPLRDPVEILRINNYSISHLIKEIFKLIPVEGNNITTKYFEINQNFNTYLNILDDSESFELEIRESTDMESIVTIQSEKYTVDNHQNRQWPLDFSIDYSANLAKLKISSFDFNNSNKYINQLDSLFSKLNDIKISNLLIDLRGNKGGYPIYAAQLLSYLSNVDFKYFKRNFDVQEFDSLYDPMPPNQNAYSGRIFVFINGGCLSTTGHLISLIKNLNLAEFIGEQPGSSFYCNDFSIQVTLPESGLEVNIPRTTFETAVEDVNKSEQFTIDYEIDYSSNTIFEDQDLYFKKLYEILLTK